MLLPAHHIMFPAIEAGVTMMLLWRARMRRVPVDG